MANGTSEDGADQLKQSGVELASFAPTAVPVQKGFQSSYPLHVPHVRRSCQRSYCLSYCTRSPDIAMSSPSSSRKSTLPEYNEMLMTRSLLLSVLYDLSGRILSAFGATVRLVVHGGAVMVLHPELACRESTRDVDYLHRAFEQEWLARGCADAGTRLRKCIRATARAFKLGADWMNACADVALPMSTDPVYGVAYDPVYTAAVEASNLRTNTIFTAPGLVLVGVTWPWAIALKLVRYQKHDPYDIANILRLGHRQGNVQWSRQLLESWLLTACTPMSYVLCSPWQVNATRQKMRHAIHLAFPHKYAQRPSWVY
ncbi:hypothetical protein BD414DRAFT_495468 [Trametes punicea]|nr:hypothetical protein BD414DRAFT_495468 [Trametes punicea]